MKFRIGEDGNEDNLLDEGSIVCGKNPKDKKMSKKEQRH